MHTWAMHLCLTVKRGWVEMYADTDACTPSDQGAGPDKWWLQHTPGTTQGAHVSAQLC